MRLVSFSKKASYYRRNRELILLKRKIYRIVNSGKRASEQRIYYQRTKDRKALDNARRYEERKNRMMNLKQEVVSLRRQLREVNESPNHRW